MTSDQLRQMAADLRKQAESVETAKMVKCAQTLKAAQALSLLSMKVRTNG